jgi:hypothetical protein
VSLTVSLDRDVVTPGGPLVVSATIRNDRPRAVTIAGGWCGAFVDVTARVAIPSEPVGRDWGGISGAWKAFALTSGFGPGGVPATDDVTIHDSTRPGCGDPDERTIGPGEIVTIESRLSAEIVDGVPALPGEVPLEISLLHDPVEPAPTPTREPPGSGGPLHGGGLSIGPTWSQLVVRTSVTVAGDAPHVLSLGEAADAMLDDRRFAAWLATMPARTWSVSNLFLQNNGKAEGIVPAGPTWEIDLFREIGVARNWAIGFVDPFSGEVRNLTFCNVPCDR